MTEHIDKNSRVSYPVQLSDILLQRIKSGYYVPGRKLDSVRMISESLGVSNITVQKALKILKDKGAVHSVPGSGFLVNKNFIQDQPSINIAFVFPEEGITPDNLKPEDWVINSEIHLGLLRGAELYGAKINFIYVNENMSKSVLLKKMREIRQNDAALFVGSQQQSIQKELINELYIFNILDDVENVPEGVIRVRGDREAAMRSAVDIAVKCECRSAGIISVLKKDNDKHNSWEFHRSSERYFIQACHEAGLQTPERYNWEFTEGEDNTVLLRNLLQNERPEFILCNDVYFLHEIYEACYDLDIKIGRDVKLMTKASGMTFQGLIPSLTYLKPPSFEIAVDIVNYACQLVRGTLNKKDLVIRKNKYRLIPGKSTGEKFMELLSEKSNNI